MKLLGNLLILLVLASASLAAAMFWWVGQPIFEAEKNLAFTVKPGSSVRQAAQQMRQDGVPIAVYPFELLARAMQKAGKIKAGSYEIEPGKTPLELLEKLINGDFALANLAIIEGWTFAQMRKAINAHPNLRHDTLALTDAELMRTMKLDAGKPEGQFFPDTYLFAKGSSDLQLYQQAYVQMQKRLEEAWQKRANNLPYSKPYDALIMASVIEKETGQKSERNLIAAVFVNRLRLGMLLQTDPTVIYGMGERYQGKIYKSDLLTDTPYNTYTRAGLPPTPIALPGLESIMAALNPAPSQVLYFVARGDGSSQFSNTLDEHNRAVNRYQR